MLAMPGAEMDGSGRALAAFAAESGQQSGKNQIAVLLCQQTLRDDQLAAAVMQLEAAVGQAMRAAERRRVHSIRPLMRSDRKTIHRRSSRKNGAGPCQYPTIPQRLSLR